jgi:hypothetical protein
VTLVAEVISVRRYDPPRVVEVESNGQWWPGLQTAWKLLDDGRGWRAEVEWLEREEWGVGKHLGGVPPERVRLPGGR